MGKNPAVQFYLDDWHRDLEDHPNEIGGAWMRIFRKLHWSNTRGEASKTLEQWAKIIGENPEDTIRILSYIRDEEIGDVFGDVTLRHKKVTVRNRRLMREERERQQARLRKSRQRHPECHADVTPLSSSTSSSSTSSSKKRSKEKSIVATESLMLSSLLQELILQADPKAKTRPGEWTQEIDKLHRLDGRDWDEIEEVIRWCQEPTNFWQPNIRSGKKLREKFDTLVAQMNRKSQDQTRETLLREMEGK